MITTIPTTPQAFTGSPSRIRPGRITRTVACSMGAAGATSPRARAASSTFHEAPVARPDRMRNRSDRPSMVPRDDADPTRAAMPTPCRDDDRLWGRRHCGTSSPIFRTDAREQGPTRRRVTITRLESLFLMFLHPSKMTVCRASDREKVGYSC